MPIATLRRAGVPSMGFDRLALRDALVLMDCYLDLEATSLAERDRLSAMLERIIGPHKLSLLGRELIALRRNIYNDRIQRGITAAADRLLEGFLTPDEYGTLQRWIVDRQRRSELLKSIEHVYARECVAVRHTIWRLVGHRHFRNALALSSRTLSSRLEKYLASEQRELLGPERAEGALASYLSRSALKLSPFSSFARSAPVVLARADASTDRNERLPVVRKVTLNRSFVSSLARCAAVHSDIESYVPVYFGALRRGKDGKLRGLRRKFPRPDGETVGLRCIVPDESVVTFRDNDIVSALMTGLDARGGVAPLHDVLQMLPAGVPAEHRLSTIRSLIAAGVLRHEIPIEDPNSSGLDELVAFLGSVPGERATRLKDHLCRLAGLLCQLARASPGSRLALQSEMTEIAASAFECVGVSPPPRWDGVLVFEDWAEPPRTIVVSDDWSVPLADLGRFVRCFAPLFDYRVVARASLRDVLRKEFGGGTADFLDVLKCCSRRAEVGEAPTFDFTNPRGLDSVEALATLRARLIEETSSPSSARFVDLEGIAERFKLGEREAQAPEHSYLSCHVQPTLRDGVNHLVLNVIDAGGARSFLRVCHALSERHEHLEKPLANLRQQLTEDSGGGMACEVVAPFDFNANLHPAGTEWTIDYSESSPRRPGGKAFRLAELTLGLNGDALVLTHEPTGRVLAPYYLGLMPIRLAPMALRLLTCLGSSSAPLAMKPFHALSWNRSAQSEPVVEYPALVFGRCLIRRKGWSIHPEAWPRRQRDESDVQYAINVRRWQRKIGLPDEVFVLRRSTKYSRRKPEYLNFVSPVFAQAFERRSIQPEHSIYIEEMSPTRAALAGLHLSRPVEFVVDVRWGG